MKRSTILDVEEKERQKFAYMAAQRAQRAAALHDPNVKISSVDTQLCEMQLSEKARRKAIELQAERMANAEQKRIAKVIAGAELDHRMQEKRQYEQLKTCWQQQGDRRQRREADLNPNLNREMAPDPEQCGLTACQKFHGEDRRRAERKRLQARQLVHFTKQQMEEKRAREEAEKENDRQYVKIITDMEKMGGEWEKQGMEQMRFAARQNKQVNDLVAMDRRAKMEEARRNEKRANNNEIDHNLKSRFLNEISDGSKANYKGMTPEERLGILVDNHAMVKEKQRLKEAERQEDRMWGRKDRANNRTIIAAETAEYEARKKAARQLQDTHKMQVLELQRTRAEARRNARGSIQGGWFEQFGTSHV
jgi:hypothetical protein